MITDRRQLLAGAAWLAGAAQAHAFGLGKLGEDVGHLGPLGGASINPPYPAPSGFHWDFVVFNGQQVTSKNQPAIALVRNS